MFHLPPFSSKSECIVIIFLCTDSIGFQFKELAYRAVEDFLVGLKMKKTFFFSEELIALEQITLRFFLNTLNFRVQDIATFLCI